MKVNISYDGGLEAFEAEVCEKIADAVKAGAEVVCESARALCPVRTGALQNSITAQASDMNAEVSANTDYAAYVEFGTSKMAPEPYLIPALLENEDAVISAIAGALAG